MSKGYPRLVVAGMLALAWEELGKSHDRRARTMSLLGLAVVEVKFTCEKSAGIKGDWVVIGSCHSIIAIDHI